MSRRLIILAGMALVVMTALAQRSPASWTQDPTPAPQDSQSKKTPPPPPLDPPPDPVDDTGNHGRLNPPSAAPDVPEKDTDRPTSTKKQTSSPADPPAPRDEEVEQAQSGDGSKLPPAKDRPGSSSETTPGAVSDPRVLSPERLPTKLAIATLSVEVQAFATANINRPTQVKILIRNTGASPAMGVMAYYPLADGLHFEKSEPPPTDMIGNIVRWQIDSLPSKGEKVLTLTVTPTRTGDFDHAATVRLLTGSRARTLVKQPKLKVEVSHNESAQLLKDKTINFKVQVTNNGTGPARDVLVHARLSPGLKHEQGSEIEVKLRDLGRDALAQGESEVLDLEADAIAGGEQTCEVWAESRDVAEAPEAHALSRVEVIEPKITFNLTGSTERYTDTVAVYKMVVRNDGTAPAKNVKAMAWLPINGRLEPLPPGLEYKKADKQTLTWRVGELEPKGQREISFGVLLGGVDNYQVEAGAAAETVKPKYATITTHVRGMPDLRCTVTDRRRVLDVGEETDYEIRIRNKGSREAEKVLLKVDLTDEVQIINTTGPVDARSSVSDKQTQRDALFAPFDLASGNESVFTVRVKAVKKGTAKCTVTLTHDEVPNVFSTTTKINEQNN